MGTGREVGIFERIGLGQYHGIASIDGLPDSAVFTDGSGWYGIMDVPFGASQLRFQYNGFPDKLIPLNFSRSGLIVTIDAEFD